jgi:hypothetical protein
MQSGQAVKIINDKYLVRSVLATNEFASIKHASDTEGRDFTLKCYNKLALKKRKEYHKRKDG